MITQRFIKFLVDESVEFRIVLLLRNLGFDVASISEDTPISQGQTRSRLLPKE